jgi:hypothetical protein
MNSIIMDLSSIRPQILIAVLAIKMRLTPRFVKKMLCVLALSNLLHLGCSFYKVPIADWRLPRNPVLTHNLTTSFTLRCQMLLHSLWIVDQERTASSFSSHNKSQCQARKCIRLVCILVLVSDSILLDWSSGFKTLEGVIPYSQSFVMVCSPSSTIC